MRHSKIISKEVKVDDSIECDICHRKYSLSALEINESTKNHNNRMKEIQEFISINHMCGYDSVFGDGFELNLDICQHCMYRIFADVINDRIENEMTKEENEICSNS